MCQAWIAGQCSSEEEISVENDKLAWKVVLQMQKDHREFFKFQKEKCEWELKANKSRNIKELASMLPNHILGMLEEEDDVNKEEEKNSC